MTITIFGKGNMGKAIGKNFEDAGMSVSYAGHEKVTSLGDIVVLAVPYGALAGIAKEYKDELAGKVVVDITNPVNFETFDSLVVPEGTSAAEELAALLPDSFVVKAFNTNFAATLVSGLVGGKEKTTVLMASDSAEAKEKLAKALEKSALSVIDAGSLKRAREMEKAGFLQMTLAAREKISWTGGFAVVQ